jgi:hypothetical protein
MKKLLLSLVAVAALAVSAAAQQYQPLTLNSLVTVAATATSNYTGVVNVRAANYVGIRTYCALSGSGTDDIVFSFSKSIDGSTFETTPSVLITNVANGTTPVNKVSIVDVTGVHTLKLVSVLNNSSSRVLTNSVFVGVKNFLR